MKIYSCGIILLILIAITACKKEKVQEQQSSSSVDSSSTPTPLPPDTIYPGNYLPAYPGSWWKYIGSAGDSSTIATLPDYGSSSYYVLGVGFTEPVMVPEYGGQKLYEYKIIHSTTYPSTSSLFPILRDDVLVGYKWGKTFGFATPAVEHYEIVKMKDTLTVGTILYNDVIGVKQYAKAPGGMPFNIKVKYYQKDIGMVKQVFFGSYTDSATIVDERILVSYFINN